MTCSSLGSIHSRSSHISLGARHYTLHSRLQGSCSVNQDFTMRSLPSITEKNKQEIKEKFSKAANIQVFLMVVAHTINLQAEAILTRNACKGNLGKAARVSAIANALAGVLGLLLNQFGGKLSDSIGRQFAYKIGPLSQLLAGLACYTASDSVPVLLGAKAFKIMSTTFSGTIAVGAGVRDMFQGPEQALIGAKINTVVGLGIMAGPFMEGLLLKYAGAGNERFGCLGLAALGAVGLFNPNPETLSIEKAVPFDVGAALKAANPFAFIQLFTNGSAALKKVLTIACLQTLIDGKNISDVVQIWTREHLKMQMESIRNFIMGYGFASTLAMGKLVPYLLKSLSIRGFTTFTNTTNFLGFLMRGSAENILVFVGALPLMLPGVNGASATALGPVLNDHMDACGFKIGESTAWVNNLRVLAGAGVTLLYGYFYSWCRKTGVNPGLTFAFAGCLGAALPQLILSLLVKDVELEKQKKAA